MHRQVALVERGDDFLRVAVDEAAGVLDDALLLGLLLRGNVVFPAGGNLGRILSQGKTRGTNGVDHGTMNEQGVVADRVASSFMAAESVSKVPARGRDRA